MESILRGMEYNVAQVSAKVGLGIKTIRGYIRAGLVEGAIKRASRSGGYVLGEAQVETIRRIKADRERLVASTYPNLVKRQAAMRARQDQKVLGS